MEQYEQTIAHLRNEITARDKDIRLAATYGKQLFEERTKLSQTNEDLLHQKELLEQEKHSLQLELETQVQTVNTQTAELELQRDLTDDYLERLQVLEKENEVLQKKYHSLIKENQYLKKAQEDIGIENKSLKDKISLQLNQIKNFENIAEKSICETEGEGYQQLQEKFSACKLNNVELQDMLSKMQCEIEMATKNESHLLQMVKDLEEDVKDKDGELSAYSVEVNKYKEDIDELRAEIEVLKFDKVDTKQRGNSVFAELDDRRTMVEREYKILLKKFEQFKKNYEINKNDLNRARGEVAILRSSVSREYQQAYIDKLEEDLVYARKDVQELTYKLEKVLKDKKEINYDQLRFSDRNEYDYLRVMLKQSQAKEKELENEAMNLRMKNFHLNKKLTEAQQMLYKAREDLDSAKQEILKLNQNMKESIESAILNGALEKETPKPKTEIIDGFKKAVATKVLNKLDITRNLDSTIIPGELEICDDEFRVVKPPRKSNKFVLQEFNKIDEDDDENSKENVCVIPPKREKCATDSVMEKTSSETGKCYANPICEGEVPKNSNADERESVNIGYKRRNYSTPAQKKIDYCAQQ